MNRKELYSDSLKKQFRNYTSFEAIKPIMIGLLRDPGKNHHWC